MNCLRRLLFDDSGQDLIEYGLLATTIGFAAVAAVNALTDGMNELYSNGNDATQSLWEPPDPLP